MDFREEEGKLACILKGQRDEMAWCQGPNIESLEFRLQARRVSATGPMQTSVNHLRALLSSFPFLDLYLSLFFAEEEDPFPSFILGTPA